MVAGGAELTDEDDEDGDEAAARENYTIISMYLSTR